MFWSDKVAAQYPQCTTRMKGFLNPKALKANRPVIYDAFIKACGGTAASTKAAIQALSWANYPEVMVSEGMIATPQGEKACAVWRPIAANLVQMSALRVIPLEECVKYGVQTDIANNTRWFEASLLHEIVHFVRDREGLLDQDFDLPDSFEPGQQFEFWAYGRLQCTPTALSSAASTYQ